MKISLIHAAVSDTPFPPLGILYIAGLLEREGHEVQVLNPGPGYHGFMEEVKDFNPRVIGFSLTTPQLSRVEEIRLLLSKVLPDVFYVCGGPHATVCPSETLESLSLDAVVIGEGEITMLELATYLELDKDISSVKGLYLGDGHNGGFTGIRELIPDLDEIPFPARHLVDMEKYLKPPGIIRGYPSGPSTAVFSGRGCAHDCIFCNSKSMFRRKIRKRSVENVTREIQHLKETYGVGTIFFPDEAFLSGKKWIMDFCDAVKSLNIQWACQSRVDIKDPKFFQNMKQAGCVQVEFGVESGSPRVLEILHKKIDPDMVRHAFSMAKSAGLRTLATFMVGNPGEEMEDINLTEKLATDIKADYTAFFFLVPYPGTELFKMAQDNGWISASPDYSTGWFIRQSEYPVMTINFSPETLSKLRGRLQNKFIFRNYLGYLKSKLFMWQVLKTVFKHPLTIGKAFRRLTQTGRFDHLLETVFATMNQRKS